jgi:hypothetical protein
MTTRLAIPLLLVLGCGPLVMIPGGSLSGDVQPVPADWSFTDEVETVQLETRPSDPYSVNVWGVGVGDIFYIASGRGVDAAWAEHIEANPNVRLRVGDAIYELDATRTSDPAELDAFLVAAKAKYDFEPEPGQRETAVLYRLTPR